MLCFGGGCEDEDTTGFATPSTFLLAVHGRVSVKAWLEDARYSSILLLGLMFLGFFPVLYAAWGGEGDAVGCPDDDYHMKHSKQKDTFVHCCCQGRRGASFLSHAMAMALCLQTLQCFGAEHVAAVCSNVDLFGR